MSPRSSNRGVCSIGPIGFHLVEDLFAFHQRKGEERDFPQGNAEGRDSGARESWLEDERGSWVLCVFVGRLDFCTHIMVPICCPVDNVAFWFSGEVFEELAELKCQTRIVEEVPEALAQSASPRASCLFSARYVRAPFPFLFVAQA